MSKHEKEDFSSCLSSRQGMKLLNVKFYRGEAKVISEPEFRAELTACAKRMNSGELKARHAPKIKKEPVDVREFVAKL